MSQPLLDPTEQRILIGVLAGLLLAVSLTGLWLCRRLSKAGERLHVHHRDDVDQILVLPDRRTTQDDAARQNRP